MKLKLNLSYLIGILFLLIAISCSDKKNDELDKPLVIMNGLLFKDSSATQPFTGRHKSKVLDKIIEYEVKDGIKNGDFILYSADGRVEMKGTIVNDKNEGEWRYYFPDGSIQTVGKFVDDIPESTWTWYYPDGKIFEQGNFVKGVRFGEWKTYDNNGRLRVIRNFENGVVIDSTVINN